VRVNYRADGVKPLDWKFMTENWEITENSAIIVEIIPQWCNGNMYIVAGSYNLSTNLPLRHKFKCQAW
jgi:hypothetical protein